MRQFEDFQLTFGVPSMISHSLLSGQMHISVASPFMSERYANPTVSNCNVQFIYRLLDLNPHTGREDEGSVADTTYSFFKEGFLQTSAVYCNLLHRWVPVLFTWMSGLTSGHYCAHFTALFSTIANGVLAQDLADVDRLYRYNRICVTVMDFSHAQLDGFTAAYSAVRNLLPSICFELTPNY
jgi:hypothetical protein